MQKTTLFYNILLYPFLRLQSHRFSDEKELRHAFNVTGNEEILPEEEIHGFRPAVAELARDFKQLATMLLAVTIFTLLIDYCVQSVQSCVIHFLFLTLFAKTHDISSLYL